MRIVKILLFILGGEKSAGEFFISSLSIVVCVWRGWGGSRSVDGRVLEMCLSVAEMAPLEKRRGKGKCSHFWGGFGAKGPLQLGLQFFRLS